MGRVDNLDEPAPGTLRWLISCDESGVGGATHYGFGSLWMKWQRRGDFARIFRELRDAHGFTGECKWNRVKARTLPFYKDLAETFFRREWLSFHCIVVNRSHVDLDKHDRDWDLARRKHFTMLLTSKIRDCMRRHSPREQTFRVWVDPIASRYKKADEAVEVISNNVLKGALGEVRAVDKVKTHESHETPSIQLCDLLLGAVMEAWQNRAQAGAKRGAAKRELQSHIAAHMGWDDLRAGTFRTERKVNIWYFWDGRRPRSVMGRRVKLTYPLPDRRVPQGRSAA
ncbi:MAG: DUF3800 domain-containing protein [Myxococcales bacterium]|nr:DUF3800 domain-containing protein [Myxococcales bacterium]